MPQMYGWWRSIDSAASRSVLISFEASLDACFAAASDVGAAPDPLGATRGRSLTASWAKRIDRHAPGQPCRQQNGVLTFSPVMLWCASFTFPMLPAPNVLLRV